MRRLVGFPLSLLAAALIVAVGADAGRLATAAPHRVASAAAAKRPSLLAQTPGSPLTIPDTVSISGSPSTVAADTNGTVYVGLGQQGSGANSDIAEFNPQGNFVRVFGAHLPGGNPLLAVGPDHNVYAWPNSTFEPIREYNPSGTLIHTIAIPATIVRLSDLELDSAGNIYATGYDNNGSSWKVFRFDSSGSETAAFAVGPADDRLISFALDPEGTLWIVRQAGDVSVLYHVDASGRDLKHAPYLGILDGGSLVRDIDYSDGRLYAIGYGDPVFAPPAVRGKVVVSTFTPKGFLVAKVVGSELPDYCCHDDYYSVAISGNHVWATGLDTAKLGSKLSVTALRPQIGVLANSPVFPPSRGSYSGAACGTDWVSDFDTGTISIPNAGHAACTIQYVNSGNPCSAGNSAEPHALFQNGNIISKPHITQDRFPGELETVFDVEPFLYGSGPVYAEWICTNPTTHTSQNVFEYKGDIELYDPSGAVVDAKSGRAIAGATVALQVSPGGNAAFAKPSFGDIRPQVNPQYTASNGRFGWDVAPGRWRVRVTAFGYRPYVSRAYHVPPPVTGLKLRLRPNPAQRRYLIDPTGRVGPLALGAKTRRIAGLRVHAVRGRVHSITILSRQFRTEFGIRLGSSRTAVDHAYPQATFKKKRTFSYHVRRATFRIRRGRVVAIVVGS